MDAHIHDGLAFAQAVGTHRAHLAHGHHHYVRFPAEGGQVLGAGVAEGHGGILAVQHHGGRLAHHQAAAHHHGALAGEGNAIILQNFKTRLCRAGRIAEIGIREHTGQRTVRNAVDVLFRGKGRAHGAVVELLGQRAEQKAPVDGVIGVHFGDDLQQVVLRGIGGQQELLYLSQRGHHALCLELFAQCGVAFVHGGHHRRALQNRCHNRFSFIYCGVFR